ncbi:hypothetical protein ACKKBG_A38035 [Auxenochlorella protothecoides x Auxenochlorella symbiontica]
MSLANVLLRKHSTIAAVLFPVSVGVGFFYTVKTGRTAAAGLREAVTGTSGEEEVVAPIRAYSMRFR